MKYNLDGICQDCMYLEKIKSLFEQLQQENNQLKKDWNELEDFVSYENMSKLFGMGYEVDDIAFEIQDKMEKLFISSKRKELE